MNTRELVDQIKATMPLSKFLEQFCGYKIVSGSGENVNVVCPYHNNKTNLQGGNCRVNDVKGVGYCFHCGEGFNYLSAYMQAHNCELREACKELSEKLGIKDAEFVYSAIDIRQTYVSMCHKWLMEHREKEGKAAWDYLIGRGFTEASIKRFKIGFNPEGSQESWVIIKEMFHKGISLDKLKEADIVRVSKKSGKNYVAFSGRVTMMTGNNVYGRTIDSKNLFRHNYTNSSNCLFNEIALSKERNTIFIVEAAFDAISIEQFCRELKNDSCCIGTLGTHGVSDEELAKVLKEASPAEVVIIPDSDNWLNSNGERHAVGQKAGLEKARFLENSGLNVRIVILPQGVDPNDLSKTETAQSFYDKYYCRAVTPTKYALYCEGHYYGGLGTSHSVNIAFLNNAKKLIEKNNVVIRKEILDYLHQLTNEPITDISNMLNHTLERAYTLSFFRNCRLKGISDEKALAYIKQQLANLS